MNSNMPKEEEGGGGETKRKRRKMKEKGEEVRHKGSEER